MKLGLGGHLLDTDLATHCWQVEWADAYSNANRVELYRSSRGTFYACVVGPLSGRQHWALVDPAAFVAEHNDRLPEMVKCAIVEAAGLQWE